LPVSNDSTLFILADANEFRVHFCSFQRLPTVLLERVILPYPTLTVMLEDQLFGNDNAILEVLHM
jgi:hypothetical protein